jgi:hypothetical protein
MVQYKNPGQGCQYLAPSELQGVGQIIVSGWMGREEEFDAGT